MKNENELIVREEDVLIKDIADLQKILMQSQVLLSVNNEAIKIKTAGSYGFDLTDFNRLSLGKIVKIIDDHNRVEKGKLITKILVLKEELKDNLNSD